MNLRTYGFAHDLTKPFLFLLLVLVCRPAAGQQRTVPDSLARDSLKRAQPDSAQADSVLPPPIIVKHPIGSLASPGLGVWEWTSEDLLREGALSLSDLLQRIPGGIPIRTGLYLQPEIAAPFGQTRGRIEVLIDGIALDPLTEATVDLSRIELAQLRRVRVERRLDVTRIDLSTLEPVDGRPVSRIEAGVGEPDANLFRGMFLAPRFLVGPIGLGVERIDTDGYQSREGADDFSGWIKWGWLRGSTGIQAELRQSRMSRGESSPWPGVSDRRDLMVRARAPIARGLVGELFAGHTSFENDTISGDLPDSVTVRIPKAELLQYGGRASFEGRYFWADASARFRDHFAFPSVQVDALTGTTFGRLGAATAAFTFADWRDAGTATSYDLRVQSPSLLGLSAFGEIAGGKRAGPNAHFADSVDVYFSRRSGTRAGLAFNRWGINASAALLRFDTDSVQSFGLPFDSTDIRFAGGKPSGFELAWSVPLLYQPLTVQGHYTKYRGDDLPIYVPRDSWLVALQLHSTPLPSKNLELLGRIEMRQRGEMLAPELNATTSQWGTVLLPSYNTIDAYVQIRVIDVRLFLRAENLSNQLVPEIPGRLLQTPKIMYGVKWDFYN
jgi:hypothetical protein